ncbi:MAG TPA: hypothetical protein VI548_10525 [Chitinophagaceae bacterium]|nr:hypothetical protein [Chitinophagaceae bacterium]
MAIVLPNLLIAIFIWLMLRFQSLEEWKLWLIIFIFLGGLISFSIWLALRVYPPTVLSINKNEIRLSFAPGNFLIPKDFSFNVSQITTFNSKEIRGDEYFIFEVRNPRRKFQISSSSYKVKDFLSFNEVMVEISEMVMAESRYLL